MACDDLAEATTRRMCGLWASADRMQAAPPSGAVSDVSWGSAFIVACREDNTRRQYTALPNLCLPQLAELLAGMSLATFS